jgi:hypothetical protein
MVGPLVAILGGTGLFVLAVFGVIWHHNNIELEKNNEMVLLRPECTWRCRTLKV